MPFTPGDSRIWKNGPVCREVVEFRREFTLALAQEGKKGGKFKKVVALIWQKAEAGIPFYVNLVVDAMLEKQAQNLNLSGADGGPLVIRAVWNGNGNGGAH